MTIRSKHWALTLLVTLPLACAGASQDSSSSSWVACGTPADCDDVPGAATCEAGYCVDSNGDQVEASDGDPGPVVGTNCKPLGATAAELSLGQILGAGRDGDVIYVADELDGETRLFVSEAGDLVRMTVRGRGEDSAPDSSIVSVDFETPAGASMSLTIRREGDVVVAVELIEGSAKEGGTDGVSLELVDEATVREMPIASFSNPVFVEYYAEIDGGERILVIRPEVDWSYEDFRVFYGAGRELAEREVTNVVRGRDGGTTTISFVMDGAPAEAFFPVSGEPTVTIDGDAHAVSPLEGEPAADTSYTCL
jgi:hypothetical protein